MYRNCKHISSEFLVNHFSIWMCLFLVILVVKFVFHSSIKITSKTDILSIFAILIHSMTIIKAPHTFRDQNGCLLKLNMFLVRQTTILVIECVWHCHYSPCIDIVNTPLLPLLFILWTKLTEKKHISKLNWLPKNIFMDRND